MTSIDSWNTHATHHTTKNTVFNSKHQSIECRICKLTNCVHMIDLRCLSMQMWLLDSLHEWRRSSSNKMSTIAVFQNELRCSSIFAPATTTRIGSMPQSNEATKSQRRRTIKPQSPQVTWLQTTRRTIKPQSPQATWLHTTTTKKITTIPNKQ